MRATVENANCYCRAMVGENRLSLRNNRLKFKTAGKLLIILEELLGYTPI